MYLNTPTHTRISLPENTSIENRTGCETALQYKVHSMYQCITDCNDPVLFDIMLSTQLQRGKVLQIKGMVKIQYRDLYR